jgi:delta-aminolevulinic acid dehydratase/porphobilinogen synthase
LPYLDILSEARRELCPDLPLACYQVSGEFAMIHAGAKAGVYELRRMAEETAESMVRAGATIILSYFTPDFLDVSLSRSTLKIDQLYADISLPASRPTQQWLDQPAAE